MTTKEYFIGAWINKQGHKYKMMRLGRTLASKIRLYIDGNAVGDYASQREAKRVGKGWGA
jgi:hypothetical protein